MLAWGPSTGLSELATSSRFPPWTRRWRCSLAGCCRGRKPPHFGGGFGKSWGGREGFWVVGAYLLGNLGFSHFFLKLTTGLEVTFFFFFLPWASNPFPGQGWGGPP